MENYENLPIIAKGAKFEVRKHGDGKTVLKVYKNKISNFYQLA
jgi:hypothetical protein